MAKRQNVNNSTSAARQLPPELVFDILTRVPDVKSLGRCRAVSKPWNSMLTRRDFIRAHITRNKEYPSQCTFLLVDYIRDYTPLFVTCPWRNNAHHLIDEMPASVEKHDRYPLEYPKEHESLSVSCCDGLVAIVCQTGQIFIQNPATRVLNELPVVPVSNRDAVSHHGFGYDSVNDDFKVVALTYGEDDDYEDHDDDDGYGYDDDDDDDDEDGNDDYNADYDDYEDIVRDGCYVSVYSVKKKTWESLDDHCFPDYSFEFADGVFLNGYFHWLATRHDNGNHIIVRFNFTRESFSKMKIRYVGSLEKPKLAVLDGCLSVYTSEEGETYICMMKEYGVVKSWTDMTVFVDDNTCVRPLCMSGKEMMMVHESEDKRTKLVRYDCEEHTLEDVLAEGVPSQFYARGCFTESLLSPLYPSVL